MFSVTMYVFVVIGVFRSTKRLHCIDFEANIAERSSLFPRNTLVQPDLYNAASK